MQVKQYGVGSAHFAGGNGFETVIGRIDGITGLLQHLAEQSCIGLLVVYYQNGVFCVHVLEKLL